MANYIELPNQNRLSGINTLAYMGTEANTPPQFVIEKRAPTPNDLKNWRIGTIWLKQDTDEIWMLVSKTDCLNTGINNYATWVQIGTGGSAVTDFLTDDLNHAYPSDLGIVNMFGGVNMSSEAVSPNQDTVTFNLVPNPVLAGGLTITPLAAPGVVTTDGAGNLNSTNGTDGQIIVARGVGPVWADIFSSDGTVIIAASVDPLHPNGINFRSVGGGGGGGTAGLVADDASTATPDPITGLINVFGSDVIRTSVTGVNELTIDVEDSPVAGGIIIGGGPGVTSTWGTLTSGGSVTITYPAPNQINLEAAGVAALTGLTADVGAAAPVGGLINIAGDGIVTTSAAADVVTVSMDLTTGGADNGKILIGGAGGPVWANIVGAGGITVTNGAGAITLTGGGGGVGGGIITLDLDSGVATDPGTHVVRIEGATTVGIDHVANPYINIQTYAPVSGADLMQIRMSSAIQLPITNAGGTAGLIQLGTNDFMHAYGTRNTFLGESSGNRTFVTANTYDNVGIGYQSLRNMLGTVIPGSALSSYNVAVGSYAMNLAQHASNCVAVGYGALQKIVDADSCTAVGQKALGNGSITGDNNTALGYHSGYSVTSGVSNVFLGSSCADALSTGSRNVIAGYNSAAVATSSADNVIIGQGSCLLATSASNNVIIGSSSSGKITSAGFNTIIGYNTADNLLTGHDNIVLGSTYNPATVTRKYSGEQYSGGEIGNIVLGSPGVAGESYATRIGDPTLDSVAATTAHMSGIYEKTLGATQHVVSIDSNGKLGKGLFSGKVVAFMAVQAADVLNIAGDSSTYLLGTNSAMSVSEYDVGGAFYAGDGAGTAAKFTAPYKGLYQFQISIELKNIPAPVPPVPAPRVDPVGFKIYNSFGALLRIYQATNPVVWYQFGGVQTIWYTAIVQLDVNDYVRFFEAIYYNNGAKVLGIAGGIVANQVTTYCAGYLITEVA